MRSTTNTALRELIVDLDAQIDALESEIEAVESRTHPPQPRERRANAFAEFNASRRREPQASN